MPPPPRTLPPIFEERLELRTWSFLTICKTKTYFWTASNHPWLPKQCPKLTHVFENTFRQFSSKNSPELDVLCYFHEECPEYCLLCKFGLDIPLDGVLVTVFVSHPFSCFNDLKLGNAISMAPKLVSFDLSFYTLSGKVPFVDFQQGTTVFDFWIRIPSQKSETDEPP